MSTRFVNARAVLPDGVAEHTSVLLEGDRIVAVGPDGSVPSPPGGVTHDLAGRLLGPGFVDLHCHGGDGVWITDDPERAGEHHLRHGTTSLLATTLSYPTHQETVDAVTALARALEGGRLRNGVGIHMEGPFINPRFGAYRELARPVRREEYLEYSAVAGPWLRRMTIAPELEGTAAMCRELRAATRDRMEFSVGHSCADQAQVDALVDLGLTMATHWANACGAADDAPTHEGTRDVGLDDVVLMDDRLAAEVIADRQGTHVRPLMLQLLHRVKGAGGVALVTDATAASGAPPAAVDDGDDVRYTSDGRLAGSALTMDLAVRNMVRHTGLPLAQVWRMASETPARYLGAGELLGVLAVGARADLVIAPHGPDEEFSVEQVWLKGERIGDLR